ncbi:Acyl-CoA dehydrogenase, C-terminal domain [Pseudomonas sp. ok272]|uniref:acyl-CoA dehydrogenase family protein n=1 Tax=unclassified Pseudomonas TaxID=196821 RepID=UPI0008C612CA|nr:MULTISPECIES: acyl-CoA dehydrogenase family protein [unclassified Pseudomonas]SEN43001.1 Acyl-CoA dehydrogenase, C-terminal domain [Pseudomonas sp. ok272]SFN25356.1 Acyl-CoA dehydrogenase, C-terminal domain [Pseudomonas sp. ok602]
MLALLNDEQQMFERTAQRLAQSIGIANPHDLTTRDREQDWNRLTEVGLLGLRLRDNGIPLASGVEVMIAAQALGETLVPQPFASAVLASELLVLADAPHALIDALAAGETRYALLLDRTLQRLASPDEPGCIAWDCAGASAALGLSAGRLVRVSLQHGFTPGLAPADLTREVRHLRSAPGAVEVLGQPIDLPALKRWYALALTTVAADIVGALNGAHAGAVAYTKERVQYGVLIGSFQAIQHLCAEMLVQTQAAHSLTCYAAWAVDQLAPDEALLAARTAKAYASSVALPVTEAVMQVYGGIGQTWEHIAHVYTRRVLLDARLFGDESHQLQLIADARLGAR